VPEFDGRVAIVTGASSGIGRATAEMLAERGARVAIFSRRGAELRKIAAPYGSSMIAIEGDVRDEKSVDQLFTGTESAFGNCDLLVNNAGKVDPWLLEETTLEAWDDMFAVNTRSVFLATRRAIPGLIARHGGTIVNVASISGVPGPRKFPGFASYCAAKAAVIAFTETMAVELREHGVRVNCVSPGSVDTPMLRQAGAELTPDMTPAEVAETILFLSSTRSAPINGQNIHVYSS